MIEARVHIIKTKLPHHRHLIFLRGINEVTLKENKFKSVGYPMHFANSVIRDLLQFK